ncbi:tRNA (adenosine(37)-N6)-threonylcarbamoyltransferase complex ATPase subunit type 1 TsaE [Altericista sp. CCNU0014]|uniref:tRNA (adenosine(37)-N6)-threonylcarbamoyltransferase complex ATPase subunit type 1 TsaE n=1 Tax=Altericista sp. CCNU0014 TaxID=3082949 RepID=UPI00384D3BE7
MADDTSLTLQLLSLEHTQALGQTLGKMLTAGAVLILEGRLGAGKTSLVQGVGMGLGIVDVIVSPTFALIHEYREGRIPLYHFDLYRLTPAEVCDLHPETYWLGLDAPLGITAIEWPERLADWPENYLKIELTHTEWGRAATLTVSGCVSHWQEIEKTLALNAFDT